MSRHALVVLLALTGCLPGRVPFPLPVGVCAPADAALAGPMLADAEAAFAKRPDAQEVRDAFRLFQSAAAAAPSCVEGTLGVVRTAAWLLEHGAHKDDRRPLADQAVAAGDQCQQRAPETAQCDYWRAVSLGLWAREHSFSFSARGELKTIIRLLRSADDSTPAFDDAGPARVLALLLVRAPGWPAGPGNADEALVEAKKAVAQAPANPLNHLVLAECLAATGETDAAKSEYEKAAELGRARADADGADWAAQADTALQKLAQ